MSIAVDLGRNTTKQTNKCLSLNVTLCCFQCRLVFGNHLVPNTLIVHLDDSHVTYTTTPASTAFDEFMHDVKVKSDSLRIMLVQSKNYTGGVVDE